jgi:hypothetical protein
MDRSTWHDPMTGLQWQCESPGEMSWNAACQYARRLHLGGKTDWRVPTVKELESLLDRRVYRPVMRKEIPFRDELSYWSQTTFGPDKNNKYIRRSKDVEIFFNVSPQRLHGLPCLRSGLQAGTRAGGGAPACACY